MSWLGQVSRAYLPGAEAIRDVALVYVLMLCAGYFAIRARSRIAAWTLAVVALASTFHFVSHEPAGARMLAIVATLLLAMKVIAASHGTTRVTFRQWIAFTLWAGMRPAIFTLLGAPAREGAPTLAREGAARLAAGAVLLVLARLLTLCVPATAAKILATPLLLVGLSLMLHFGLLNLGAALWRAWGVPAERLFRDPLHARSLADFWSRRWNIAFSEMTAVVVQRPIKAVAGRRASIFASFLVSGLLHEMAISVPARGGYGLPTLYFALQGALVVRNTKSRTIMFAALIAPILLVFHLPFLRAVIWPLAGIH
ncbi:MAG: hypothetical protein QOK37_1467 [Thermoanaerobaculia bacterium]|jgi:alginate O-acetyltransferase complex protein AlgI|nr:hypothetical protein [Thermoanaerobaculia bacterium]